MTPPTHWDTDRLHLRPPMLEDAEVIFDLYAQDLEVVKYLTWLANPNVGVTCGFVKDCIARWQQGKSSPWVILRRADSQVLGMIEIRIDGFRAELGYVLARRFWGQGYMTEAVRAVADWSLAQPSIYRVWAVCDVENQASARVMEKAGMQREGLLRRWSMHPNVSQEPRDSWCYAKVR